MYFYRHYVLCFIYSYWRILWIPIGIMYYVLCIMNPYWHYVLCIMDCVLCIMYCDEMRYKPVYDLKPSIKLFFLYVALSHADLAKLFK